MTDLGNRDPDAPDQKAIVRRSYDEIASEYDAERADDSFPANLFDDFRRLLPDRARVLDAGCGAGRGPLERAPESVDAVGLDVSLEQLRLADERVDAHLLAGDMVRLPFVDDAFDGLTAFYSTIHVPIDEHLQLYREFARVLRPGSPCLLTVSEEGWIGENDDWLETGERMVWSFPDLDETVDSLENAGFSVVDRTVIRSEMDDAGWPFLLCRAGSHRDQQ